MDKKIQKNKSLRRKAAIAILLANKLGRQVSTDAPEVESAIAKTGMIAKKICAKLVKHALDITKADKTKPPSWTHLPVSLKNKFADILEKKSFKKNGLLIERCKRRWLALSFLYLDYVDVTERLGRGASLEEV